VKYFITVKIWLNSKNYEFTIFWIFDATGQVNVLCGWYVANPTPKRIKMGLLIT